MIQNVGESEKKLNFISHHVSLPQYLGFNQMILAINDVLKYNLIGKDNLSLEFLIWLVSRVLSA